VAAASRHAQPATRTRLEFYGEAPENWTPFRPAHDETVFELARAALSASSIEDSVCYPATERLAEDFSRARAEGRVVVVVVDPWLADSEPHRDILLSIVRQAADDTLVAGTIVVFNSTDDETTRSIGKLRVKIGRLFKADRGETVTRFNEVRDAEEFAADLVPVVVRARNARVGRAAASRDGATQPAPLAGPRGETWVDLQIWFGNPMLPRYGDGSPERWQ
jgi:FxsC-like protein